MTLRRTASQRPQFGKLSNGEWRTAIYQPKGEYLEALIRSYLAYLREHDRGRDEVLAEVARLRHPQQLLAAAREALPTREAL